MNTTPRPGSLKRIKGHIQISPRASRSNALLFFSDHIEARRFHVRGDNVYYINGRKQIFLLGCASNELMWFESINQVLVAEDRTNPVMFTPITHLEYVFS